MPAVATTTPLQAAVRKDLYEIGEVPPLGHVPSRMHAWAIRKERHGPPEISMQLEVLPTWPVGEDEVLVYVMAGGVNYNGVWAGLGVPISPLDVHKHPFHIAGSDASGIVWACGSKVRRWKVGDEVIVHCNQDDGDDEDCNGGDPLLSPSQRIWGYETPDGSFAQFCRVQSRQLMPKPAHLSWEEAACYTLTLATASTPLLLRIVRSSMLEVINLDYVRTARAKGVSEWIVIWHHALINAALPLITVAGLQFGLLLGGAIITETVFAVPGVGRLIVGAIRQLDFPIVQAGVFVLALIVVFVNFAVDLLYMYLNPQIRVR